MPEPGADPFIAAYRADVLRLFRYYKGLAERAMARVTDDQFYAVLDPSMNSIAVNVHHLGGNQRSRWRDFLTTDGEKPDRDRDAEFADPPRPREALMKIWEEGWDCALATLESLSPSDFEKPVTIRGEPHSVIQAINRSLTHNAYHCGQIVLLAKHFQHAEWKSLSVARGKSQEYTRRVSQGERGKG